MSAAAKPKGAYRPPGARGTLASDAYKRDENDHTASASSPASAPGAAPPAIMFRGGKPTNRYTPGLPPGAAPAPAAAPKEEKKKRVRTKRTNKADAELADEPTDAVADLKIEDAPASAGDEAVQKKIRGLNKKVSLSRSCW
jgi:translation initiation factor 2A